MNKNNYLQNMNVIIIILVLLSAVLGKTRLIFVNTNNLFQGFQYCQGILIDCLRHCIDY